MQSPATLCVWCVRAVTSHRTPCSGVYFELLNVQCFKIIKKTHISVFKIFFFSQSKQHIIVLTPKLKLFSFFKIFTSLTLMLQNQSSYFLYIWKEIGPNIFVLKWKRKSLGSGGKYRVDRVTGTRHYFRYKIYIAAHQTLWRQLMKAAERCPPPTNSWGNDCQGFFLKPTRVSLPAYSPRSWSRHVAWIGVYRQTRASVDRCLRWNMCCCWSPQQRSCRRPGRPAPRPTVYTQLPPSSRGSTSSPASAWRGLVWPELKTDRWHEVGDPGLPL